MHDPTLDKKPVDMKDPDNLDLQEKYILETVKTLAKHYKITEDKATIALGYVMKWTDSYPAAKEVIITLDMLMNNPINKMTEEERLALLAVGHLVRKLPPFKSSTKNIGRNDPCPCGSTKKFKQCCLGVAKLNEVERYKNGNK